MLSPTQIGTLRECLVAHNLLSFKPLMDSLSHSPELKVEWFNTHKPEERYLYAQTHPDSKVLAVAHTDIASVGPRRPQLTYGGRWVKCPQLDDRLGCWILLHVLRQYISPDQPYDILLTDFEETSNSTARLFNPPEGKKYNWIFEFDRRGTDVVMYDYETPALKALLEEQGFEVGRGSFTDICYLYKLGCAGFNFGTGYRREHSTDCHADLVDTFENIDKFLGFYRTWYDTHLEGDQSAAKKKMEWRSGGYAGTHGGNKTNSKKYTTSGSHRTNPIGFHNTPHTGIGTQNISYTPSKKAMKRIRRVIHIDLDLGDNAATTKLIDAMKLPARRRMLIRLCNMAVHEMTTDEFKIFEEFIVPLIPKKGKVDAIDKLLLDEGFADRIIKMRAKLDRQEITKSQYDKWLSQVMQETQEQWDAQTTEGFQELPPFDDEYNPKDSDLDLLSEDEYNRYWSIWMKDEDANLTGISFKEWYKSLCIGRDSSKSQSESDSYNPSDNYFKEGNLDDTDLEPTDKELLQIEKMTDKELREMIMNDPMYASDEFPGGEVSQSQYLQKLRGLL